MPIQSRTKDDGSIDLLVTGEKLFPGMKTTTEIAIARRGDLLFDILCSTVYRKADGVQTSNIEGLRLTRLEMEQLFDGLRTLLKTRTRADYLPSEP